MTTSGAPPLCNDKTIFSSWLSGKYQFFKRYADGMGDIRSLMLSVYAVGVLVLRSYEATGRPTESARRFVTAFDAGIACFTLFRLGAKLVDFFTGILFFKVSEDENHKPITGFNPDGTPKGGWKLKENTGTYENGAFTIPPEKEWRHWMDIAEDLSVLAGRILSPLLWLNEIGIIELAKNAKEAIGTTLLAITGFLATFSLINGIRNYYEAPAELKSKAFADGITKFLEAISTPFDYLLISGNAIMLVVSGVISLLAGAWEIGVDFYFTEG